MAMAVLQCMLKLFWVHGLCGLHGNHQRIWCSNSIKPCTMKDKINIKLIQKVDIKIIEAS